MESTDWHRKNYEIGAQEEAEMEDRESISADIKDPVPISPKEQATFLLLVCMRKYSGHLVNIFVVQANSSWLLLLVNREP